MHSTLASEYTITLQFRGAAVVRAVLSDLVTRRGLGAISDRAAAAPDATHAAPGATHAAPGATYAAPGDTAPGAAPGAAAPGGGGPAVSGGGGAAPPTRGVTRLLFGGLSAGARGAMVHLDSVQAR